MLRRSVVPINPNGTVGATTRASRLLQSSKRNPVNIGPGGTASNFQFVVLGLGLVALAIAIATAVSLGIIVGTTGRNSRKRDRKLQEAIDAVVGCNCTSPVKANNITIPENMVVALSDIAQNITSGAGFVPIVYGSLVTKLLPTMSGMNISTGVFTAPDDGMYSINWFLEFNSPMAGPPAALISGAVLIENWVPTFENINLSPMGDSTPYSGSVTTIMAAGETAVLNIQNESGFLVTINAGVVFAIIKMSTITPSL